MTVTADVVISYLEMSTPAQHRASPPLPPEVTLRQEPAVHAAAMAGALYRRVGAPWQWRDRAAWTDDQWRDVVDGPGVELWTARMGEEIAGYFQLYRHDDVVEISYFGLVPERVGQGLGGPLLSVAITRAWQLAPRRVILNTCTLDHPAALPNYLARGFTVVATAPGRRRPP